MASPLPYYPLYVADFDEDAKVLEMNLSEVGLYLLALNEGWKRGGIPDQPKELARMIRRRPAEVVKAWPRVSVCWMASEKPGMLVNQKQEKERKKAIDKCLKTSAAAAYRDNRKVPGYIYLLRRETDGLTKIGSADYVPTRIAQLRHKYRDKLELLHSISVTSMGEAETSTHERYSEKRKNGEWFQLLEEDIADAVSFLWSGWGNPGGDKWGNSWGNTQGYPAPRASESKSKSLSSEETSKKEISPTRATEPLKHVSFEDFCYRWNRHKGFKKPGKPAHIRAAEKWQSVVISEEELDAALDGYHASKWGREESWPMLGFVKNPHSWIGASEDDGQNDPPEDVTGPQIVPKPPEDAELPPSAQNGVAGPQMAKERDWLEEWNRLVPEQPTNLNGVKQRYLEAQVDRPEFCADFGHIVSAAKEVIAKKGEEASWVDLYWLCKYGDGESRANWERLLNGDLRHMRGRKSKVGQAANGSWKPGMLAETPAQLAECLAWKKARRAAGLPTDPDVAEELQ